MVKQRVPGAERIVFGGKDLPDDAALAECGVTRGSTLDALPRCRGGAPTVPQQPVGAAADSSEHAERNRAEHRLRAPAASPQVRTLLPKLPMLPMHQGQPRPARASVAPPARGPIPSPLRQEARPWEGLARARALVGMASSTHDVADVDQAIQRVQRARPLTRAAAAGFLHKNGVREFLHDITSELVLQQPEDPRKYLYEKLSREFRTEEPTPRANEEPVSALKVLYEKLSQKFRTEDPMPCANEEPVSALKVVYEKLSREFGTEEPVSALDGEADCLRVYIDCSVRGRVQRRVFVRRAPPLPCPPGAAGTLRHIAASRARVAAWQTEALSTVTSTVGEAAGISGESATREISVATSNTAAAPAPVPGAHDGEGEQAMLERAEGEILSFFLIRGGGGAGGDAALATEFFERPDEVLDAQQLGVRMQKVLGVSLEPAVTAQLLTRLLSASACGKADGASTKSLSPEALCSWVHKAYPLFELEQMLLAVHLHKILARHLVCENEEDAPRTRDDVHVCVLAAASDIVDGVYGQIAQLEEARRAVETGGANVKFAGDDLCGNFDGTFEGKFASAEAFHGGLDRSLAC
jgi:hypothetical protein